MKHHNLMGWIVESALEVLHLTEESAHFEKNTTDVYMLQMLDHQDLLNVFQKSVKVTVQNEALNNTEVLREVS